METFVNPPKILKQLNLRKNMKAADFGSGSGGWVIPLAKKLESGKVYAIDVLQEPLSALESKISFEKINNIEIIHSNVENQNGSTLPNESLDLVLMTNLLFLCDNKKNVLIEAKRVLRPDGKVLVVDWVKDNPLTPQIEYVSFDEIRKLAKEVGFKVEKEFEAGSYHEGLILAK